MVVAAQVAASPKAESAALAGTIWYAAGAPHGTRSAPDVLRWDSWRTRLGRGCKARGGPGADVAKSWADVAEAAVREGAHSRPRLVSAESQPSEIPVRSLSFRTLADGMA